MLLSSKRFTETVTVWRLRVEFCRHYNLKHYDRVPSAHAINTWIRSFEETGSAIKKKPPGRNQTFRTPENIETVRGAVIRGPHRSLNSVFTVA